MLWRFVEALCSCSDAWWKPFAHALALCGSALLMLWRLLEALCWCPGAYWKRFAYAMALVGSTLLMPWRLLEAHSWCPGAYWKRLAYALVLVVCALLLLSRLLEVLCLCPFACLKCFAYAMALIGSAFLMPCAYWKRLCVGEHLSCFVRMCTWDEWAHLQVALLNCTCERSGLTCWSLCQTVHVRGVGSPTGRSAKLCMWEEWAHLLVALPNCSYANGRRWTTVYCELSDLNTYITYIVYMHFWICVNCYACVACANIAMCYFSCVHHPPLFMCIWSSNFGVHLQTALSRGFFPGIISTFDLKHHLKLNYTINKSKCVYIMSRWLEDTH